jgi:hypothetical protein
MNTIPQPIKTRLAQLATFPEKYNIQELASELQKLSAQVLSEEESSEPPTLEESYGSINKYKVRSPYVDIELISSHKGITELIDMGFQIIG